MAQIVRRLSFGRKAPAPRREAPPAVTVSAEPGPRISAPAPAALPQPPPAQPAPAAAAAEGGGTGGAQVKRRTLSFGRRGRGSTQKSLTNSNTTAAELPRAATRLRQPTPPEPKASVGLRRTSSWQRGHRQARGAHKAAQEAAARAMLTAAPSLLAAVPPAQRAQLAQVSRRLREVALEIVAADGAPPPPAIGHTCFTHEGGAGGRGKENQDTYFVAHPSKDVALYAVFDGHGKKYGRLAAHAAAAAAKAYLCAHHRWLLDSPQEAMRQAFGAAHAAVRAAMLKHDPSMRVVEGAGGEPYLLAWLETGDDEGPSHKWDAADGGTTATIAAVLRGRTLVLAAVGDSAAVLMAREEAGATHELLVEEHVPTSLSEYVRMSALPSGRRLKFVYDCPDFEEFDIFCYGPDGQAMLDASSLAEADAHNVMVKNSREDRFTLVMIPEETVAVPPGRKPPGGGEERPGASTTVEEQAITMTRSLGDFYAHHHGVSWEPETCVLPLARLAERGWRQPLLMLASDGVWDLWGFDEVAQKLVSPDNAHSAQLARRAVDFCEQTRARGHDFFDEAADNLTGVMVALDAAATHAAASRR